MTVCHPGGMSERTPNLLPSWIQDEPPSEDECQAAGEYALEHGVGTTVYGVDEYRMSTRPGVVTE